MTTNTDLSKLDDLIVTTIDSVKGFEHAADHADAGHGTLFRELANERREVVSVLQAQSRSLKGSPNNFGSAAATLHRGFENVRLALGGGEKALLKEIEHGEKYLAEEFGRALRDNAVSPGTREAIERAFAVIERGSAQVSRLEMQAATAA